MQHDQAIRQGASRAGAPAATTRDVQIVLEWQRPFARLRSLSRRIAARLAAVGRLLRHVLVGAALAICLVVALGLAVHALGINERPAASHAGLDVGLGSSGTRAGGAAALTVEPDAPPALAIVVPAQDRRAAPPTSEPDGLPSGAEDLLDRPSSQAGKTPRQRSQVAQQVVAPRPDLATRRWTGTFFGGAN